MLEITDTIHIQDDEIIISAVRSQGAGGQNVNKLSTAIHLRFDIHRSSLPESYKSRLLNSNDKRINKDGVIVIKAQQFRTQEKNRIDAIERLKSMIISMNKPQKRRIATKPGRSVHKRRVDNKTRRGRTKNLRSKPEISG